MEQNIFKLCVIVTVYEHYRCTLLSVTFDLYLCGRKLEKVLTANSNSKAMTVAFSDWLFCFFCCFFFLCVCVIVICSAYCVDIRLKTSLFQKDNQISYTVQSTTTYTHKISVGNKHRQSARQNMTHSANDVIWWCHKCRLDKGAVLIGIWHHNRWIYVMKCVLNLIWKKRKQDCQAL